MKRISLATLGVALATLCAASAHATVVHNWQFDEPDGTVLTATTDSVGGSSWIYDLGYHETNDVQTSTVQGGAFNIRRPGAGHNINSFAPVGAAGLSAPIIQVIADVTWDYTPATATGQDFRMGFHNASAGANTTSPTVGSPPVTILAEIVLRRNSANNVQLGAWGTNEAGVTDINPTTTMPYVTVGNDLQADPLRLMLELNLIDRTASVHWSTDAGATFSTVGGPGHTAALNATWDPNFVRLGAINNFQSGPEPGSPGLFIHDLQVVAIPEPSSVALLSMAFMGLLGMARRTRS